MMAEMSDRQLEREAERNVAAQLSVHLYDRLDRQDGVNAARNISFEVMSNMSGCVTPGSRA